MNTEILNFIQKRFSTDEGWCTGNCYWFAAILKIRFPKYDIYLFPIENHFMIGNGDEFYDWNGCRLKKDCDEDPILWNKVKEFDELYYNRIIRDCID